MLRFILYRLALIIPTFIGVTIIAFIFIRILPGDPVTVLAGERGDQPRAPRRDHGTARLRPARSGSSTVDYLTSILQRRFRHLVRDQASGGAGVLLALPRDRRTLASAPSSSPSLIGIPVGIFAAVKRGSWFDQLSMGTALVGYSMPIFWWGLLLIIFFAGYPRTGPRSPAASRSPISSSPSPASC